MNERITVRISDKKRATVSEIDAIIETYINHGGDAVTIREGVLGHGFMIIRAPGLKTVIVKEYALNEWSSVHDVSFWNKMPKKYQTILDNAASA